MVPVERVLGLGFGVQGLRISGLGLIGFKHLGFRV